MSKLWLIGLAASAAWTPAAVAQGAPAPHPMAHGTHAPGPAMHGGGHKGMKGMHGGGHHMKGMKGMHGGGGHMKGARHWQRFGRGHVVPHQFRGRQFFVNNWQSFGWPAPIAGGQWIRYYDDALLIDRAGRVMDSRYGWDWDRRGGHSGYDEGYEEDYGHDEGYYGRDEEEYGDDDGYERGGYDDGRGHHDRRVVRHHPGYGQAYGYGYGAGCACGPVVITETTTTTAPVVETHTYYETVYEHRAAPRRHYKKPAARHYSKPVRRYVKPAPRPGERG
jgi:Ni/Co efflux regulator RcnB